MEFSMENNIGLTELLQTFYLIMSLRLSFILNQYSDPTFRKWFSSILGLTNLIVILNVDSWHFLLACLSAIILIIWTGPKYCHILGFIAMFSYLTIYRMYHFLQGIVVGQTVTVVQSLATLMIVGVAFEIHSAYKRQQSPVMDQKVDATEDDLLQVGFFDIFHYVFNFATVCSGPYVRYQVYSDFIKLPFARAIRRTRISLFQICVFAPCCILLFALLTDVWPIQFINDPEFTHKSFLYRLNYSVIQWMRYRIFLYSNFGVIRLHSVLSGLGAYPFENKAISAHGPTINKNNLRKITYEEAKAMDIDLNTTIVTEIGFETLPSLTSAIRCWNKCVQYWLGVYIYKQLPRSLGRPTRLIVTFFVSSWWHAVNPSVLISSIFYAYYYFVESMYIHLQKQFSGQMAAFMNVCFWISRQYSCSWFMMAFLLLEMDKTLIYYKTTYFSPLLFTIAMHLLYLFVFSKLDKKTSKVIK